MKITIERKPETIELLKAVASTDETTARNAQNAIAAYISKVAAPVLMQAGMANLIYTDFPYDEDSDPSIPMDLFYGEPEGAVTVWSQQAGGGVPSSYYANIKEFRPVTYTLDSAVSTDIRHFRKASLPVVEKLIARMLGEVLVKQERNAWAVILKALAESSYFGQQNVIRANTNGTFQVDDINSLWILIRRINAAFSGGTPEDFNAKGLTDLFGSPEFMGQIRSMSYQPQNTRAQLGATGTPNSTSTALGLPDAIREQLFNAAGTPEIWNIRLHDMLEFGSGTNRKYNALFSAFAGSTNFTTLAGTGSAAFAPSSTQIVVGVDASRDACLSPIATNSMDDSVFRVKVDNQYVDRDEKVGWNGRVRRGHVVGDSRALVGCIF